MATHELGICGIVIKAEETYPWSLVVHIFRSGLPSHDGDHETCNDFNLTSKNSWFRKHKHWNIVSTGRYTIYVHVQYSVY